MIFDEYNLQRVARGVIALNPSTAGRSIEDVVENMKRMAYIYLHKGHGYTGTGGWMLTAFKVPWDDEIRIKASLSDCLDICRANTTVVATTEFDMSVRSNTEHGCLEKIAVEMARYLISNYDMRVAEALKYLDRINNI